MTSGSYSSLYFSQFVCEHIFCFHCVCRYLCRYVYIVCCVYICMYVHVICVHTSTFIWNPQVDIGWFPQSISLLWFETWSLTKHEGINLNRLASQLSLWVQLFPLQWWDYCWWLFYYLFFLRISFLALPFSTSPNSTLSITSPPQSSTPSPTLLPPSTLTCSHFTLEILSIFPSQWDQCVYLLEISLFPGFSWVVD